MKQRLYIFLLFVIFYSCKKEIQSVQQPNIYLEQIKSVLKDSLAAADFDNLVMEKAVLSKIDSLDWQLLRIPFRNKNFCNDFVLLKTKMDGSVIKGKIIQLSDNETPISGTDQKHRFNGDITISSLSRQNVLHSKIQDGYIEAFYQQEKNFKNLIDGRSLPNFTGGNYCINLYYQRGKL